MTRLRAVLQLVRLPNLFTAVADVWAGAWIARADATLPEWAALTAASVFFYAGGVVLNDVCDAAVDQRERPDRPIPSGAIPRSLAAAMAVTLLAAALVLCAVPGRTTLWIGLLLTAAILGYDALLKATFLGPAAMGACRALNLILGMTLATSWTAPNLALPAAIVWLYVASLTYFARDEALHSPTSRLRIGAAGLVSAALAPVALYSLHDAAFVTGLLPAGALLAVIVGVVRRVFTDPGPRTVQGAVGTLVLGLIVLEASLVWIVRGPLYSLPALALLIPAVWSARHLSVT